MNSDKCMTLIDTYQDQDPSIPTMLVLDILLPRPAVVATFAQTTRPAEPLHYQDPLVAQMQLGLHKISLHLVQSFKEEPS